jgi:HSP20 family molecular chaperone IbpA
MMRRMMDDMDRLFSDFGFMHPGQLASSLFGAEPWTTQSPQRTLGAGSSAGTNVTPQRPRGQQGLQRSAQRGLQSLESLWSPQVEVFERGNNLVVRADLPGMSREDVDVEVDDDALIVRGERRHEFENDEGGVYRSERSYGSFYRAIPLPEGTDPSACQATFRDGVLEITLPKPQGQQNRARRIDVK